MSNTLIVEDISLVVRLSPLSPRNEVFYPETDGKPMGETDAHRKMMNNVIEPLERHFIGQADVYVTGNIMFYYVEGDNRKSISPDAMVVKGVAKRNRRIFRLWDERPPCVVFEISSNSTRSEDFKKKLGLYAQFGVPEYYIFDPEQMNAAKAWTVFHLVDGAYQRQEIVNGRIFSRELGLEIVQEGQTLRFFDPATQQFLPTNEEVHLVQQQTETELRQAEAEYQLAETARRQAETERQRAETERDAEVAARRQAESRAAQKEAEVARLLAELAELRGA